MRRAARSSPSKRVLHTVTSHSSSRTPAATATYPSTEVWHIGDDGAVQHLLDNPHLLTNGDNDQSNDSSFNIQRVIEQYEHRVQATPDEQFQLNDLLEVLPNRHRLKRLKQVQPTSDEADAGSSNAAIASVTSTKRKRKASKKARNAQAVDSELVNSGSDVDVNTINDSLDSFYAKVAAEDDSDDENPYRRPRPTARTIRRPAVFLQHAAPTSIAFGSYMQRIEGNVALTPEQVESHPVLEVQFTQHYDLEAYRSSTIAYTSCQYFLPATSQSATQNGAPDDHSDSDDDVVIIADDESPSHDSASKRDRQRNNSLSSHSGSQPVSELIPYSSQSILATHRSDNTITDAVIVDIVQLYSRGMITLAAQYVPQQHAFHTTLYLTQAAMQHQIYDRKHQSLVRAVVLQWGLNLRVQDTLSSQLDDDDSTTTTVASGKQMHSIDTHALYEAARPISGWRWQHVNSDAQVDQQLLEQRGLKAKLLDYQLDAVQWMMQREMPSDQAVQRHNKHGQLTREVQMYWRSHCPLPTLSDLKLSAPFVANAQPLLAARTLQYNRMTGQFLPAASSITDEEMLSDVQGGILGEEMGLGKTVECLALITARPYSPPTQPMLAPTRQRTPSDDSTDKSSNEGSQSLAIACYCGDDDTGSDEPVVQCQLCKYWQHQACVAFDAHESTTNFICPTCASTRPPELTPTKATLIVCPDVILKQWQSEVQLHTASDTLRTLIYTGVKHADQAMTRTQMRSKSKRNVNGDVSDETAIAAMRATQYSAKVDFKWLTIKVTKQSVTAANQLTSPRRRHSNQPHTQASSEHTEAQRKQSSDRIIRPVQLQDYDVILTTYSTLHADIHHAAHRTNQRGLRHKKRFRILPCPLTGVHWHRVIMDEVQMLGDGSNQAAEMVKVLQATHRWSVSGTPLSKGLEDLYGSLTFLGMSPYDDKTFWRRCVQQPIEHSNPHAIKRLQALLSRVMWRNTKAGVANQLQLPPLEEHMYRLYFTPVERYYYKQRQDQCLESTTVLQRNKHKDIALTHAQLRKVFFALLKLRQACIHPQIGANTGFVAATKQTLSMQELTQQLMDTARNACEEQQRLLYAAMFGLAALAILQDQYMDAIELYEEVLMLNGDDNNSAYEDLDDGDVLINDEKTEAEKSLVPSTSIDSLSSVKSSAAAARRKPRREIRIDPLQRIHALYNLSEALVFADEGRKPAVSSRTNSVTDATAANGATASEPLVKLEPIASVTQRRISRLLASVDRLKTRYLSRSINELEVARQDFKTVNEQTEDYHQQLASGKTLADQSDKWYMVALGLIQQGHAANHHNTQLETLFIDRLKHELRTIAEPTDKGVKSMHTIANSFSTLDGLKLLMQVDLNAINESRQKFLKKLAILDSKMPTDLTKDNDLVDETANCGRCKPLNTGNAMCQHCRAQALVADYELKLYRFRNTGKVAAGYGHMRGAQKVGGVHLMLNDMDASRYTRQQKQQAGVATSSKDTITTEDGMIIDLSDESTRATMLDSEVETIMRSLAAFTQQHLKDQKQLVHQAQQYIKRFEFLKREFIRAKALLDAQHEQLGFVDELRQCSQRIRYKQPGEEVDWAVRQSVVEPGEIPDRELQFKSDRQQAAIALRQKLSQLHFLQEQLRTATSAASRRTDGTAAEDDDTTLCPICKSVDLAVVEEFVLLRCGHQVCNDCLSKLQRLTHDNIHSYTSKPSIKCPTCRGLIPRSGVHYVRNKLQDENGSISSSSQPQRTLSDGTSNVLGGIGTDVTAMQMDGKETTLPSHVNGSWSTKIGYLIATLLVIVEKDPTVKVLIFSEWSDVLTIVSRALSANSIHHVSMKSGSNAFQHALQQFKTSTAIRCLLLPLSRGGAGVNITEASHVFFVEPSLQPARMHQAIGRIFRMGQKHTPHVHHFVIDRTIEDKVIAVTKRMASATDSTATSSQTAASSDAASDMLAGGKNEKLENLLSTKQLSALLGADDDADAASKRKANGRKSKATASTATVGDHEMDAETLELATEQQAEHDLQQQLRQQKAMESEYWTTQVLLNNQPMTREKALAVLQRQYYYSKWGSKSTQSSTTDSLSADTADTPVVTSVHYGKLMHLPVVQQLAQLTEAN